MDSCNCYKNMPVCQPDNPRVPYTPAYMPPTGPHRNLSGICTRPHDLWPSHTRHSRHIVRKGWCIWSRSIVCWGHSRRWFRTRGGSLGAVSRRSRVDICRWGRRWSLRSGYCGRKGLDGRRLLKEQDEIVYVKKMVALEKNLAVLVLVHCLCSNMD